MKIFIFGSNGMLGHYISNYLQLSEIIELTRSDYDLNLLSINTLTDLLLKKGLESNDVVINCAGVIPQASKQRDLNTKLYFKINSLFPVILSTICDKYNAKMIHVTTDCVFSGKKQNISNKISEGNYNEQDIHDETSDYGISKSLGELAKCTIIRTSIIGEEINNKRSLLEWTRSQQGKEINGYVNHYWNGVTCLQLAKIIHEIIEKNMYWEGVRHIFSDIVSKYTLIGYINNIYQLDITINRYETDIVDKTLSTIYEKLFDIPPLLDQVNSLYNFKL